MGYISRGFRGKRASDREDARRAIGAANAAFPSWAARTGFERAALLHRVADA